MTEKLQKVLARLGVGSRRELDALIAQGRVEVNGKIATVGERVEDDITVKIDGKVVATPLSMTPKCRVLMYYKPEGELTTIKDPDGRPTVFDHIPKPDFGRWIYVGRLDLNTSGLLLFTTDGELANALMHPKNSIERVYAARIYGDVSDEQISKLLNGVELADGSAKFDKISRQGGDGRNQWFHVSLKEGRNREVRRLWEAVGLQVSRLIRIKYAGLSLDETLKTGQYRELSLSEINNIRAIAGLKALSDNEIARTPLIIKERGKKGPKQGSFAPRPKGGKNFARNLNRNEENTYRSRFNDVNDDMSFNKRRDFKKSYNKRRTSFNDKERSQNNEFGYRRTRDERSKNSYSISSKDGFKNRFTSDSNRENRGYKIKVVRSNRDDSFNESRSHRSFNKGNDMRSKSNDSRSKGRVRGNSVRSQNFRDGGKGRTWS